jgi:hypothetical protein
MAMLGGAFNRKEVSRERVMGLTLIDVFLQFIFMLLGLLLYIYVDDFDREKWDKFARDGKSIYGAEFSVIWPDFPLKFNAINKQVQGMRTENEKARIIIAANGPGKEACLEPKADPPYSAHFSYTRTGIKFNGFTNEFINYINNSSKDPSLKASIINLNGKKGTVFNLIEFDKTFKVISETSCQHKLGRDESNVQSWMTDGNTFRYYQKMKGAITRLNK